MEKVLYTEESISEMPAGADVYNHLQGLREELDKMEVERDNMLTLLYEVADASDAEELDEVLVKVREFVEGHPYPTPY